MKKKIEPRSTFTFALGLSYIASILFTRHSRPQSHSAKFVTDHLVSLPRDQETTGSGDENDLRAQNLHAYAGKNYATVEIHPKPVYLGPVQTPIFSYLDRLN